MQRLALPSLARQGNPERSGHRRIACAAPGASVRPSCRSGTSSLLVVHSVSVCVDQWVSVIGRPLGVAQFCGFFVVPVQQVAQQPFVNRDRHALDFWRSRLGADRVCKDQPKLVAGQWRLAHPVHFVPVVLPVVQPHGRLADQCRRAEVLGVLALLVIRLLATKNQSVPAQVTIGTRENLE